MDYYRGLLTQSTRIEAFRRHIAAVVRPGDRVLEIGTGLGTFAFFAAAAGAAKVWAVEGGPIISVAKALARANGYADRVEFIRGWFPDVDIPERADVLIFENYPTRLVDSWTFDALSRLHRDALEPGARIVPARARLHVAPMHSDRLWQIVGPLDGTDAPYGIDWRASREYISNTPLLMPIKADDLRHEPQVIAQVHLDQVPGAAALAGEATWTFHEGATLHGLAYWFELEVGEGEWLSNAPNGDPGAWGHLYLPVEEPAVLAAGDELQVRVAPEASAGGAPSWLTWELAWPSGRYRGHEFKSFPASLADVIPTSPSWIPTLSRAALLEREILSLVDGHRTVDEIALALTERGDSEDLARDEVRARVFSTLAGRTTEHKPKLRPLAR